MGWLLERACFLDGISALLEKRKGSPCQQGDSSPPQSGKRVRYTDLPKDIWQHIHSLLPLRDAARTACVSRAFLHSWRHHSTLTFTFETICSINVATDFTKTVSHIMKKHSGIGVKALKIDLDPFYSIKACSCLDTWLQIAVTPRIQELTLVLSRCSQPSRKAYYNFPCSLLSDGGGSLIQVLHLRCCTFHPTAKLGSFGSLTRLHLISVHISGDELGCLLSNSLVLEQLILNYCDEITYVKVPFRLQQLSYMEVYHCDQLQVIENKAPNLRNLCFIDGRVQLSFGESLLVKNICMLTSNVLCHACVELPSVSPNLKSLTIVSSGEMVNTCTIPRKFLHLKYLHIALSGINMFPSYDYFSLVSFLDASPYLETFILDVTSRHTENDSIFVDSLHLRQMPEHRHDNLRNVKITCFRSAKSLVELTCHILKNTSVKCLTLDTTRGYPTCSTSITGRCFSMGKEALMEAHKALLAISTYIEGKVPSSVVKLNIVPPCSRCHAIELQVS